MSKIDFNKKTKLTDNLLEKKENLKIIDQKNIVYKNKSFRFRAGDLYRIKKILKKTNEASNSTIFKETDIIRGLLALGDEISGEKIISYIRKSI
ncbi:hypothetical protein [Rickettsiales endosymbiont of Trichoplax sp. H2]|uniref:hypothetical protein n=1 Tax=Rickettsiales endosymbiont of Trichoplax sp. H2 TaxID=2021221 RepID=UPI0012B38082|nr:hypothetical protein [Rickettsiales endosymbiont of Trichoplax sp. H2]MSO14417.1 hypothetical protein [Rickettsiales endosymbiont of Trichoplax sp. H2]